MTDPFDGLRPRTRRTPDDALAAVRTAGAARRRRALTRGMSGAVALTLVAGVVATRVSEDRNDRLGITSPQPTATPTDSVETPLPAESPSPSANPTSTVTATPAPEPTSASATPSARPTPTEDPYDQWAATSHDGKDGWSQPFGGCGHVQPEGEPAIGRPYSIRLVLPKTAYRPGTLIRAAIRITNDAAESIAIDGYDLSDDGVLVDAKGDSVSAFHSTDAIQSWAYTLAPGGSVDKFATIRTTNCGDGNGDARALPEGDYQAVGFLDGDGARQHTAAVTIRLDEDAPIETTFDRPQRRPPYTGGPCALTPGAEPTSPRNGWTLRFEPDETEVVAGEVVIGTIVASYDGPSGGSLNIHPGWNPDFLRDDAQATPVSPNQTDDVERIRDALKGDRFRFRVRISTRGCPDVTGERPALAPGDYTVVAGLAIDSQTDEGDYGPPGVWLAAPVSVTLT